MITLAQFVKMEQNTKNSKVNMEALLDNILTKEEIVRELGKEITELRGQLCKLVLEHGTYFSETHNVKAVTQTKRTFKWDFHQLKQFLHTMELEDRNIIQVKTRETVNLREIDKVIEQNPGLKPRIEEIGHLTVSDYLIIKSSRGSKKCQEE